MERERKKWTIVYQGPSMAEAMKRVREAWRSRIPVIKVDWEILPPGKLEGLLQSETSCHSPKGKKSPRRRTTWPERIRFLNSFLPDAWVEGKVFGRRVYLVALFVRSGIAVADSMRYGNALYAAGADRWQEAFSVPKDVVRRMGAIKITHHHGWKERVRQMIR